MNIDNEEEISQLKVEKYDEFLSIANKEGLSVVDECKKTKNNSFRKFIQEFDVEN